jgi:galactokinase
VHSLRDADLDAAAGLTEPLNRRVRHVITENGRVLKAATALRAGDFAEVGTLMFQSHTSLRDDFEVSSRELDLLVDIASDTEGVVGARMTGAGFGGCTVNLVRADTVGRFQEAVRKRFRKETGLEAAIYVCSPSDGLSVTCV